MRVHFSDIRGCFRIKNIDFQNKKVYIMKREKLLCKDFSKIEKILPEMGDTEYKKLSEALNPLHYKTIFIPKKNGKVREVYSFVNPENTVLQKKWLRSKKNNSISTKECIKKHLGKKYILKLDIKNAFGSVYRNMVPTDTDDKILLLSFSEKGMLLQGTPCSSYIFEQVFKPIDKILSTFGNYSRYVDDISYSSDSKEKLEEIARHVEKVLIKCGFNLNKSKTKILAYNKGGFKVHGVFVCQNKMGIRKLKERAFLHLKHGETEKGLGLLRYIKQFVAEPDYIRFMHKAQKYTRK